MMNGPGLAITIASALVAALAVVGQPAPGQASDGGLIAYSRSFAAGAGQTSPATARHVAPANWKAVLVGGSHLTNSHDNAASDIAARLRANGVHRVAVLPAAGAPAQRGQLQRALHTLGSTPDDACFVFITSHANERGLYLSAERAYLGARELSRIIDAECGQRPTVLILSGCGTGAFIAALAGANRIILAASAYRRSSYGATTTDRYVNFDRCLIAAMDSGARTWRDVFDRTLPCVIERERWLGVAASRPQAWFGAQVGDLSLPGRR